MGKITVRQENVDEYVLDDLILALEKATGCKIKWSTVYEVETDDPKVAAILQTVFSGNENNKKKPAAKETKINGGKAGRVVKNKWNVLTGIHAGEVLVTQKVNKMIKTGDLAPGTRLDNPKLGVRFVSNGKLIKEPDIHPAEVKFDQLAAVPA
jgi:hypothetical protein